MPSDRKLGRAFLLTDFEKTYDTYLTLHRERSEAIRMYFIVSAVPFILASLFGLQVGTVEKRAEKAIADQTQGTFAEFYDRIPRVLLCCVSNFQRRHAGAVSPFRRSTR